MPPPCGCTDGRVAGDDRIAHGEAFDGANRAAVAGDVAAGERQAVNNGGAIGRRAVVDVEDAEAVARVEGMPSVPSPASIVSSAAPGPVMVIAHG